MNKRRRYAAKGRRRVNKIIARMIAEAMNAGYTRIKAMAFVRRLGLIA